MDISNWTDNRLAVVALILLAAVALLFFNRRTKRRPRDENDNKSLAEEMKRKRIARFQRPRPENAIEKEESIRSLTQPKLVVSISELDEVKAIDPLKKDDMTLGSPPHPDTKAMVLKEPSGSAKNQDKNYLDESVDFARSGVKTTTSASSSSTSRKNAFIAQRQLEGILLEILQVGHSCSKIEKVSVINSDEPFRSNLVNGTLTISFSWDCEGMNGIPQLVHFTKMLDFQEKQSAHSPSLLILQSCLPTICESSDIKRVMKQLEWISCVFCICDPFSPPRRVTSLFTSLKTTASDNQESESDPLSNVIIFMTKFRNACIKMGSLLIDPVLNNVSEEQPDFPIDSSLPPLFQDESVEMSQFHNEEDFRDSNAIVAALLTALEERVLSIHFFNELFKPHSAILKMILVLGVNRISCAMFPPRSIFSKVNCDLIGEFPFATLNALQSLSPMMGTILALNIVECNQLQNDIKEKDDIGRAVMEKFLISDLFCASKGLELTPKLNNNAILAAASWTNELEKDSTYRAINSRIKDVDRIIYQTRELTFDLLKHAAVVDKGRYKRDLKEFFTLIFELAIKRELGRPDDIQFIRRGFEPEGKVLSGDFVFGAVDAVVQLLSCGGVRVFELKSFLEKRQKELCDPVVIASLSAGKNLQKCNMDVFLLFYSVLFLHVHDREMERIHFNVDAMRKSLDYSSILSPDQKSQFNDFIKCFQWSSTCRALRPKSVEHMGQAADMFSSFLLLLIDSDNAQEIFYILKECPFSLFKSLSYIWSTLTRSPPTVEQVMKAEKVVYVACILLNRPDLLDGIMLQSHWVDILSSICGQITVLEDDDEFSDECTNRSNEEKDGRKNISFGLPKWKKSSSQNSAYFGVNRAPYSGAIFDSERNVNALPIALLRMYISCQSMENWDADRDRHFNKILLRKKIGHLLIACLRHPLHSDAILNSLHKTTDDNDMSLLSSLLVSVIDQNISNLAFVEKRIEFATDADDIKKEYFLVETVRQGLGFLMILCEKMSAAPGEIIERKMAHQAIAMFRAKSWIEDSNVDLGLNGTMRLLERLLKDFAVKLVGLCGEAILAVVAESCIDTDVHLVIEDDLTGLSEAVARGFQEEAACRSSFQDIISKDGSCDDLETLKDNVQQILNDSTFVSNYYEQVSEMSNVVESISSIPGFKFEKVARESSMKGSSRRVGVLKAWKQVAKRLESAKGEGSFHPNGSILIKYLESDASCARAVLSVDAETPYAFGLFFFDIWLPPDYPFVPPMTELITTAGGTIMLSPNLYTCGKVCMSLLNTAASGSDIEKWQPGESTVAQVLLTIQTSLLGDSEPKTKEGAVRGSELSLAYNKEKHFETVRWGMLDALVNGKQNMGEEFGDFIACHFAQLDAAVRSKLRHWWLLDNKCPRFERCYAAFLEELNKLRS